MDATVFVEETRGLVLADNYNVCIKLFNTVGTTLVDESMGQVDGKGSLSRVLEDQYKFLMHCFLFKNCLPSLGWLHCREVFLNLS